MERGHYLVEGKFGSDMCGEGAGREEIETLRESFPESGLEYVLAPESAPEVT